MLKIETTVQANVVQGAIDQAANYLMRNLQSNGRFRYRINTNSGINVRQKYDIQHHASCVYALSLYQQYCPSEEVRLAVKQSARYLCKEAIQPIPGERATLAIWARPDIHHSTKPLQARLDGAGVGLWALSSLHALEPGLVPINYLRALGRFIVSMQRSDNSFYAHYVPVMGGKAEPQLLQHYPMEAVLGLIMLYEQDPDGVWLETACRVLNYLVGAGQPSSITEMSPCTLLAIAKLLSLNTTAETSISREVLIAYARQLCANLLQQQVDAPRRPKYSGGFSKDGVIAPTAAWIEGLLATLIFLPKDDGLTARIRRATNRGVQFLLQAQIRDGKWAGAMPRAVGPLRLRKAASADFNQRVTEVRIDYVQQAMRAWMSYGASSPGWD